LILVFKSGTAPHLYNINVGSHGRPRSNVWSYPRIARARRGRDRRLVQRADAKPVALMADIIKDASARGDVVLAAFAGCDAALLAAEETGRRAAVVDSDPRRVDQVIRRWQALTGKQAICVNSGETFAARTAVLQAASARTGNTGEHT
jgi:DNA modification methylase